MQDESPETALPEETVGYDVGTEVVEDSTVIDTILKEELGEVPDPDSGVPALNGAGLDFETAHTNGHRPAEQAEAPEAERRLFSAYRAGDEKAVTAVLGAWLEVVKRELHKHLADSEVSLPEGKEEDVLDLAARHFPDMADRYGSFDEWLVVRIRLEAAEMMGEHRQERRMQETDVLAFFEETYEAFREIKTTGWSSTGDLSKREKEIFEAANKVFSNYADNHGEPPISLDKFKTLIRQLQRTTVALQNPEKHKGKIPADSWARRMTVTDFTGEALDELLRLALESKVQEVEEKARKRKGAKRRSENRKTGKAKARKT